MDSIRDTAADPTSTADRSEPAAAADWWRGAVIYQIYPRSYQDTNGDGIGDLSGIAQRLDHVASLGVDAIWISPFMTSPMKDFGYDISDYRDVDPIFGTLDDFDRLIDTAHGLGLKVIIDQVLSHSSDQHAWFKESRGSRENAKADWYVWAEPKDDGTPPNNWLSVFGGPAWHWDSRRRQYFLHNFLASQPDLNFHNRDVQDALLGEVRFWLDRGVDGFRLDTANFYVHDAELRDNPVLPNEKRSEQNAARSDPYNFQDHVYDRNRPETLDFMRRLRSLVDEYDAALLGEIGERIRGSELMAQYSAGGDKLHMCYAFDFLSGRMPQVEGIKNTITRFEKASEDGWACWAFSNHDVARHATRWAEGRADADQILKLAANLLMTLRGSVCLYQGEELGLTEADIAFEDIVDPQGLNLWPDVKTRDGCRTPMAWDASADNGGFSNGKPWLPIPPEHLERAVDRQERGNDTLLHHYRRLIAFRKTAPSLVAGELEFLGSGPQVLAMTRSIDGETCLCVFNLADDPNAFVLPDGMKVEAMGNGLFDGVLENEGDGARIALGAHHGWVGRVV